MTVQEQLAYLKKSVVDLIPEEELEAKLIRSQQSGKPLLIKAGFDPTAPDIHLGHCVLLTKLRKFQELGHEVCFIVGDFTARIGDPTGRSELRPVLSDEQIRENARTYTEQAFKILDRNKTKIVFNSEWFDAMSLKDIMGVMRTYTVARILEREDFSKRMAENKPISLLEFLYPLLQGYDSVKIRADVELGGTDQKFNLLVGRHLQESFDQKPQVIMTLPLLVGLDGAHKMSKSLGNYIGVNEAPDQIFGKIMSLSDDLMYHYYDVFTDEDQSQVRARHPKEAKMDLGARIVAMFYDEEQARAAREMFEQVFSRKDLAGQNFDRYDLPGKGQSVIDVLISSGKVASRNEARRLLSQGGVQFEGEKIADEKKVLNSSGVLKIGKKKFLHINKL